MRSDLDGLNEYEFFMLTVRQIISRHVPTKHIQPAEAHYGLGVSDLKRIDLVKLGWKEDVLLA